MTIKSGEVSIAILDDYLDIGRPKFARLVDRVEIVTFPDTLQTIDPEQREALIERLHPFAIISTMRERTVLSADVLKCLPNLKLILTTGLKNAAIGRHAKSSVSPWSAPAVQAGPTGFPPKISRRPRWTQPCNTPGL
jgi:hypothetical protein